MPICKAESEASCLIYKRRLKVGSGLLKFFKDLRDLFGEKAGAARERRYLPLFAMITMTYHDAQVICEASCAGKSDAKLSCD